MLELPQFKDKAEVFMPLYKLLLLSRLHLSCPPVSDSCRLFTNIDLLEQDGTYRHFFYRKVT